MKILFIGNFDGADYTTENHHKRTYEKLGHTVIPFQENKSSCAAVLEAFADISDEENVALCWTHTHNFRFDTPENIAFMLDNLKAFGVPTYGYHLDLWLGLEREKDLHSDPYWGIQYFFTVDKLMADWLNKNTKTKGFYLPAGVLEDECYMAKPDYKRFPHEIIFTGAKGYHHEYNYRPQLIEWLQKTYGNMFAHYGGGGKPVQRGDDLNVLYASAKIVVGDTLCKNFDYPFYFSDRAFEVPGRGGFMIFPIIRGIEMMYDPFKELILYKYNDFNDLEKKINWYLEHDNDREKVRLAGHNRAKSSHNYTVRLTQLLETLEKEKQTA